MDGRSDRSMKQDLAGKLGLAGKWVLPGRTLGAGCRRAARAPSLSGRLLGLTAAFVLLAEVLIFVPSLASFHRAWLQERVNAAQIAALALEAAPDMTADLRRELLVNAEVKRVALTRAGRPALRLDQGGAAPSSPVRTIDLRTLHAAGAVVAALDSYLAPPGRTLRVLATPRFESGAFIEIVIPEAALKRDMRAYALRILLLSLIISGITAELVYLSLNAFFVRPMRRLTAHIESFEQNPEDVTRAIRPSGRRDEIGRAEVALAQMEQVVRASLRQRERLAGLGAAVAKIAHDLRNSLATAQLITDRLAASDDPKVRQCAPRLERAVERAGRLAETALCYGRAEEAAAQTAAVDLAAALEEAADDALAAFPEVAWRNSAPAGLSVCADPEHLHRIFVNLIRNAAEALEGAARRGEVRARVLDEAEEVLVEIADDGPGLPAFADARLFEPFERRSRHGGWGLGLAIARELARGMGGDVRLAPPQPRGAAFHVALQRV